MLRLDILKELLPSKIWTVLQAIVRIVSLIFFLCMFVNSLDLLASMQKTSRVSAALGIPYTFIYLSTVLGFGLAVIRGVQMIVEPVIAYFKKKGEAL